MFHELCTVLYCYWYVIDEGVDVWFTCYCRVWPAGQVSVGWPVYMVYIPVCHVCMGTSVRYRSSPAPARRDRSSRPWHRMYVFCFVTVHLRLLATAGTHRCALYLISITSSPPPSPSSLAADAWILLRVVLARNTSRPSLVNDHHFIVWTTPPWSCELRISHWFNSFIVILYKYTYRMFEIADIIIWNMNCTI